MVKRTQPKDDGPYLFEMPEPIVPERKLKRLETPIWSENKAKLIANYLRFFVLVTKHGTYIDGFAGPQCNRIEQMWSAKLVLESKPRWLRNFYMFDCDRKQVNYLNLLKSSQPPRDMSRREPQRVIEVKKGDFNVLIHNLLSSNRIGQKEATFCLLDQRTFECHWSTIEALARYKKVGNKIELFYFLPNFWLPRSFAALKDAEKLKKWWGRDDYDTIRDMSRDERMKAFVERFKNDLGYKLVKAFPILQRSDGGGSVMYYMIHATDYAEAPMLMTRAYNTVVKQKNVSAKQMPLTYEEIPPEVPIGDRLPDNVRVITLRESPDSLSVGDEISRDVEAVPRKVIA